MKVARNHNPALRRSGRIQSKEATYNEDDHEIKWAPSPPKKKCLCCPHTYISSYVAAYIEVEDFEISQTIWSGKVNQIQVILPKRFTCPRKEKHLSKARLRIMCYKIEISRLANLEQEPNSILGSMCFALKTNFPTAKKGITSEGFKEIGHFNEQQFTTTCGDFGIEKRSHLCLIADEYQQL